MEEQSPEEQAPEEQAPEEPPEEAAAPARGRPKGRADAKPRARRTAAEVAADKIALAQAKVDALRLEVEAKEASKSGEDWNGVLRHHQVEGGQATADQRQWRSED